MVGAPRILQSVAADNIFPWRALAFFGEGRGVQNEPVRAYFLTFVLATACVLIGELDQVRGEGERGAAGERERGRREGPGERGTAGERAARGWRDGW